jgi:hypothetical protein
MDGNALTNINPPNQKEEVLADRMGSIIHGNPREYARATKDFQFFISEHDHVKPTRFSETHPAPTQNARMLHKWADILQREGATYKNGDVKLAKALKIFARSRDLTEGLLYTDGLFLSRLASLEDKHSR